MAENATRPFDLLIRGARVIDAALDHDGVADIAVRDRTIAGVGDFAAADASRVLDGNGLVASAGWVDLHAHLFDGAVKAGGVDADRQAGITTGVTTVVDAGSAGAGTWEAFCSYVIDRSRTRVLGFLNVSLLPGAGPRHGDWRNYDQGTTIRLAEREAAAGRCLGIKVLASKNHVGNLGLTPLKLARQAARLSGTGLMVHLGEAPPIIEDVLNLLDNGDIVTHCWKGTRGNLLDRNAQPLPETWAAVERGVKFDIGHGQSSFSFETARAAIAAGLPVHAISTDLHGGNVAGPVVDQATTMAKFLHLGFDLPEVVRLSTLSPAQLIGREDAFGSLRTGLAADITLFRVVEGEFTLTDAERRSEQARQIIEPVATVRAGEVVKESVEQGKGGAAR